MRDELEISQPCECDEPSICGMEIRGVYDGVLYWFCLNCGVAWQRWAAPSRLHDVAAKYIAQHNENKL